MYHRLYYFQNNGDPTAPSFAKIDSGHAFDGLFSYDTGNTLAPYLVDFDGDGDLDLVAAESDTGALAYAENVGTPTSPNYVMRTGDANPFSAVSFSTNSYAYNPACADVDNDGLIDVVVGDRDTDELLWFRNEAGTISGTGQALDIDEPGPALEGYAPTFADVDGDGDLDLVAGVSDGTLRLYVRDYCVPTSPCNSNGICNTARVSVGATMTSVSFSEASCECLVGFEGTYCERCQSGFFGTSCDLCPEGGDEDRKSPRLTDTCGVKNSGVSRGTCDDGTWGGGTCECLEPFSGDGCLDGSCPNGTRVATTPSDGYNFATCEACASGFWSLGPDAATCTKAEAGTRALPDGSGVEVCAPGTYAAAGAVNCSACDDGYWSDAGATTCVGTYAGTAVFPNRSGFYTCPAGTYSDNRAAACTPCPAGFYAASAGSATCTEAAVGTEAVVVVAVASKSAAPTAAPTTGAAAPGPFTPPWKKPTPSPVPAPTPTPVATPVWRKPTPMPVPSPTPAPVASASTPAPAPTPRPTTAPVASSSTSSDATSSDDCLPSTLYLTFSGYSSWNGDYDYVAAGSDFTDASEYDICDDSYHLWSKASGTGVLCWSASSQFSNQWIYLYFNGYGASMYGGYQCSDYTADPTDCDMISSTYGLSSASASGCASSEAVVASPTPRPTTAPVASSATSSDASSSDDCLPSTRYLTFSGYSSWNGDYDYVAAGSDFTDASEYDICDDSYRVVQGLRTGVLCWSASSQFSNQWICRFNGYGRSAAATSAPTTRRIRRTAT
ncbi:calcium ion binding protein [Aureococcus anophagefferens]|nr:calcium ion binding protein [Aureococcus anophagefferens]